MLYCFHVYLDDFFPLFLNKHTKPMSQTPTLWTVGLFSVSLLVLLSVSCKKTDTTVITETGPPTTAAQLRQRAIDDYNNYYISSNTAFAWSGSTSTCAAGTLPVSVQDKVIKRINFYRRIVGLPTNCVFTTLLNEKSQQAALMMQSNQRCDGTPNPSWSCYSIDGANAWTNALAADGYIGADAIDTWMIGEQDQTGALLDRRWILFSRGKTYGHGSANSFAALYAKHNFNNPPTTLQLPQFIAYPPAGYIASDLFYPNLAWSFSIPNADFRTAAVTVKNADGITIQTTKFPVLDLEADNTLVFRPKLTYALTKDTKFSVTVANVRVNGSLKTYNYDVIWVKR